MEWLWIALFQFPAKTFRSSLENLVAYAKR
jgi:hypothetical protein